MHHKNIHFQINSSNTTRLGKILNDLVLQKATRPLISGTLSMELLIDAGIEKLCADYMHIILGTNLMEQQEFHQSLVNVLSDDFNAQRYQLVYTFYGIVSFLLTQAESLKWCFYFVERNYKFWQDCTYAWNLSFSPIWIWFTRRKVFDRYLLWRWKPTLLQSLQSNLSMTFNGIWFFIWKFQLIIQSLMKLPKGRL